jgi:hypothetical protein
MYQLYRDRLLLILFMMLANIATSAWCLYLDPVINFDGVTYLKVAQLFLDGRVGDAFEFYSWPFYPLFIAGTAKLLMLDLETAAFVLNTLLATSLTLAFVCIVAELSNNNRRIVAIAVLVVLLFPSISKYRSFIIRDFGYLGCYLWSLYFILRFCATTDKRHLIGWLVFAGLSSLFRFEGIVFILIAPYFLFLFGATSIPHRKTILTLLSGLLAVSSMALLFWYVNDKYMASVEMAKNAGQDIQGLSDLFLANIQNGLDQDRLSLLGLIGLMLTNIGDVSYELIRRMAVFFAVFSVYAFLKLPVLRAPLPRKIWLIYLATNLLMLLGFNLFNSFLVSRYTMASALTLLILAPFTIDHLIILAKNGKTQEKLGTWFALAVLVLVSLEGLNVKTDKGFIRETGQWIDRNLPKDARIYTNNKLLAYYSRREGPQDLDRLYSIDIMKLFMWTGEIKTFDYVVLIGSKKDWKEDTMRQTLAFKYGYPIKSILIDEDHYSKVHLTSYNLKVK